MSSSLRRGTLAATALVLSAVTLTACAAGNDAQTLGVRPDHAAASVDDIKIQSAVVITSEGGEGPAAVTARIHNEGDKAQTLESVRIKGFDGEVKLSPAEKDKGKKLTVPAHGHLTLGGKGNASALTGKTPGAAVRAGDAQQVTFVLSTTGKIKLRAVVMSAEQEDFAKFGPSGEPSQPAKPSESPSGEAGEEPGGTTPTGEPTGSPTDGGESTEGPAEGAQEPGDEAADGTQPDTEATTGAASEDESATGR